MRAHLAAFALCALLPAWLLAGGTLIQLAQSDRASLIREARNSANAIAYVAQRELAGLRGALVALGGPDGLSEAELDGFAEQSAALRRIGRFEVLLMDEGRRVVHSAGGPDRTGQDIPALGPMGLLPGGPMAAGIIRTERPEQFRVIVETATRAISSGDDPGSLAFLTDPLALWSASIEATPLPAGWSATIVDGNDRVLAHTPFQPGLIGQPARRGSPPAFRAPESIARHADWQRDLGPDAHKAYLAWHRIEGTPWVAVVSVPPEALDASLRDALLPIVIGGLLVLPLTILLAWWGGRKLVGPLGALADAASAIARGEAPPPVRSGVWELDMLGASLTAAADERRRRDTERLALADRLETVLDSTSDGVIMFDTEGRFTYLNPRAAELLGPPSRLLGREIGEAFPMSPDNPLRAALLGALMDGRKRSAGGLHPNRAIWMEADYYPSAEGVTVFFRDVSAAKAAEAAMRQGEMRLKAVLDSLPVGVLLAEAPSGRILLGNRRMEEITRHALILSPDIAHYGEWALAHPDGRPVAPAENPLARVLATGAAAAGEYRYRRGDGTNTWIRLVGAPTFDAGGRLSGAVLACTEIAEERRAAEALRASEQRFRTLAAAVPQIVWSALPDGVVDYVNPRFIEFTGLGSAGGQPVDPSPGGTACHPQDVEGALAAWRHALEHGEPYAGEYRLRAADGTWRWFTARALPVLGERGRVTRWIGAATDVTDLVTARVALENQVLAEAAARQAAVAAAEALAASEERFRRFAEASPDVMWIADVSGQSFEYISPAVDRIWGIAPEAVLARPALMSRRIHPEDRKAALEAWRGDWAQGRLLAEYRLLRDDGSERWVRVLGFPILDSNGNPTKRGGFARDITAEKAAEARQGLLIGELNHRVKNTLATVHSLALQTARAAGTAPLPLDRFLADFQARLLALSRGHDLLTARTWHGATMMEVARAALLPWQPAESDLGRLTIAGPRAWLAPKQALGLSLALHELATNAAKHGAISRPEGKLALRWAWEDATVITLHWQERGGPPTKPPSRRGFGTRLLERGLPAELGPGSEVSLRYLPEGFEAVIRFKPIGRVTPTEGITQ